MTTPLSPTYARHTMRGLLVWLMILPCGLLNAGCVSLPKLLVVVAFTSYIMVLWRGQGGGRGLAGGLTQRGVGGWEGERG